MIRRALLMCLLAGPALAGPPAVRLLTVDPLINVFRETAPPATPADAAEAARGEVATLQAVIFTAFELRDVSAACTNFTLTGADDLNPSHVRFVGYVPVRRPIKNPPADILRPASRMFPDPLLEVAALAEVSGAQPIWVTVPIPADAPPGLYRATLTARGTLKEQPVTAECDLLLRVYPVTVRPQQFQLVNWFRHTAAHLEIAPERGSPADWELLRRYARNLAAHRQNVALVSPLRNMEMRPQPDGTLEFDFSEFDQRVRILTDAGVIGRLTGGHIGTRLGGWESQFGAFVPAALDQAGKPTLEKVPTDDPRVEAFYRQFLPALVAHLRERGWLEGYLQHIADEPMKFNRATYLQLHALFAKYAPELPIIEATHDQTLEGVIDVWVPQLHDLARALEHYKQRQAAGDEVWLYTCLYPQGEYANRFIELPLIKTRLLHWINFRYGIPGYLHWAYNAWSGASPFEATTRDHGDDNYLPAGDAWIVYPGKDGPLDSIRWEQVRDGVADFELLSMLAEHDADAAQALARRLVKGFDAYETDVTIFRETRRELLERLSAINH